MNQTELREMRGDEFYRWWLSNRRTHTASVLIGEEKESGVWAIVKYVGLPIINTGEYYLDCEGYRFPFITLASETLLVKVKRNDDNTN